MGEAHHDHPVERHHEGQRDPGRCEGQDAIGPELHAVDPGSIPWQAADADDLHVGAGAADLLRAAVGADGRLHLEEARGSQLADGEASGAHLAHEVEVVRRDAGRGDQPQLRAPRELLSVDAERERISLGIKQLDKDPFSNYLAENPKNSIVTGTVLEVDARGATIELADGIEGYLRASELDRERVEDARTVLKVGDSVEAKFIGVDRKKRSLSLSVKAKDYDDEAEVVKEFGAVTTSSAATIGDLIKEQMDSQESNS